MRVLLGICIVLGGLLACAPPSAARGSASFTASTGRYTVSFSASQGVITIKPRGSAAALAIREVPGSKALDLFSSVTSVHRAGSIYTLRGKAAWASFTARVQLFPSVPGLIRFGLTITPRKSPPAGKFTGDAQLATTSRAALTEYAPAPPVAGTSVMVSSTALHSTMLYFENLTSLGKFFDRTGGGVTHGVFSYPNAGAQGALVGVVGSRTFGYPLSAGDLGSLPHGKATAVLDTFLYLLPQIPTGEAEIADTYLKLLDGVYSVLPRPAIPAANWAALADQEAADLLDPANIVTVNGVQYLRSYVSDTRTAPELITQAGVLAGVEAYEAASHRAFPLHAVLDRALPTFYDPEYHSIVNGLGHDPNARGESWYFVTNMISLLQLAQLGDSTAKTLLLNSVGGVEDLAHVNGYEFPQNFAYSTWDGKGTGVQADVAGGYAWLMLGLYDLTKQQSYLTEAETSIVHLEGKGFGLSYETHMTAYAAAAAQRLYAMTGDARFQSDALLALANLFHATRLWDCTYGLCRKGAGYHTFFGINPLPWSDYTAMLEQYEAWLGLRDFMGYASQAPAYARDLVQAFLTETPLMMQYTLPPRLPAGVAITSPGEYAFVSRNVLAWDIPLEDLRTGEQNSGLIGQEIYGAGGPFMFAAHTP